MSTRIGLLLVGAACACLGSCAPSPDRSSSTTRHDTVPLSQAEHFELLRGDGYTLLHVLDPWQDAQGVAFTYALVDSGRNLPPDLHADAVLTRPLRRLVCLSSTHLAQLEAVDGLGALVGISGADYVYSPRVRAALAGGQCVDLGFSPSLNFELLLQARPDAVLAFDVGGETQGLSRKLAELGIPLLLNADYLERTPLGRAEWVRFMGELLDKADTAARFFAQVEDDYQALAQQARQGEAPPVMLGLPWQGTWHLAGGKSFMAKLIADAGGDYLWRDDPSTENLPMSLEAVVARGASATVWLNPGTASTRQQLLDAEPRLADFPPLRQAKIYNSIARTNAQGGNDYFETAVVRPDWLLADLHRIFQGKSDSLHFFVLLE